MKKFGKIFVAIAVVAASIWMGTYFSTALGVREAKIQALNGDVHVKRAKSDSWIKATKGMTLKEGDVVRTKSKSKVVLELDDKSVIQLTSLSQLTIDKMTRSLKGKDTGVDMKVGKGWNKVKKQKKQRDKFNVGTPTAVAGVRGTYFSNQVEESSDSTFDVFEGEISVHQKADPSSAVYVRTNKRTEVKKGQGPSAPSAIPQDELEAGLTQGIEGAMSNVGNYDLSIDVNPPTISAGGKAVVNVQFMENGKPYNGVVVFTLTLGGNAAFLSNNSQALEIASNEKGFVTVEITDSVKEQVSIGADVSFEVQE